MATNNVDYTAKMRAMRLDKVQGLISSIFDLERPPEPTVAERRFINRICNLPIDAALKILNEFEVETLLEYCLKFEEILDGLRTYRLPIVSYELNLADCVVVLPSKNYTWRAADLPNSVNRSYTCLHVLMSIIPGKVEELSANVVNFEDITDFHLMRHVKKFVLHPLRYELQQPNLNSEKLCALLNQLPALEKLEILTGDARGCDKFYTVDHLKVVQAQWLDLDVLKKMQNKTISLTHHKICMEVFTEFLRLWQTGAFPKLEMFRLEICEEEWPLDQLLGGLGGKMWDYKKRQQWYFPPGVKPKVLDDSPGFPYLQEERSYGLQLGDAWDIERTTEDGRTIIASVANKGFQLIMIVWEEPFPSKRYVPELKRRLGEMREMVNRGDCQEFDLFPIRHRIHEHEEVLEMLTCS